jgi:nitrate reductase delta subunit
MYLTYWVAGDTRNRGRAILRFAETYRAAGVEPPPGELPDHLTVALEFAALVDPSSGYELLAAHRTPVAMLAQALRETGSVYADTVALVLATLPAAGADDLAEARRLTLAGPPVEAVGLDVYPLPHVPMPVTGGPR